MSIFVSCIVSMINRPHQSDRRSCSHTANHNHLNTSFQTFVDIVSALEPGDRGCLDVPEYKERNNHDTDTAPQPQQDVVSRHAKVWDKRKHPPQEITQSDRQSGDIRSRVFRLGHLVMEAHEKVDHIGWIFAELFLDGTDDGGWEVVFFEDAADEVGGLTGVTADEVFGFGQLGSVGGSFTDSTHEATETHGDGTRYQFRKTTHHDHMRVTQT